MLQLATIPTLSGLMDDVSVDDGSGPSTFDQISNFLDSSTGQNVTANILNLAAGTQGKAAVFKNPNGTFSTAMQSIDPKLIIGAVLGLGLLLYFGKKR